LGRPLDACRCAALRGGGYSSSDSQRRVEHELQEWIFGFVPSSQSRLPHLPHRTEVLIGGSKVVSIRYITRPASGILVESGSHAATFSGSTFSSTAIPNPATRSTIPEIASGAAMARAKAETPDVRMMPLPSAMQTHAARTVLVLRLLSGANCTGLREVSGA